MAKVKIRYWAAAKQAAGTDEEWVDADTLGAAVAMISSGRADGDSRFAAVLARSSFLIDGQQPGNQAAGAVALRDQQVIEVLPPFAGG
jgi:molybdopterin synthase sulfur carrier subunit